MSSQVLNQISFKRESVWGTPVVPDKSIPVRFDGGIQTNQDIQLLSAVQSKLAKNYDSLVGNRSHEGDFTFDLFSDYPGFFLLSALGDVSSALHSGETIVYDHTFSETEVKPSLTIEQMVGENVRRFAGVTSRVFKVTSTTGQVVEGMTTAIAKSQATATAITPVYTNIRPFNFADANIIINGTTMQNIEEFEIEYTNNIEYLHAVNSNDPKFRYLKGSEVRGKIKFYLDSTSLAELNNYLSKTEREIVVQIIGDSVGVAANYEFKLTIPRAIFTTAETVLSEDYNALDVEFQGLYDYTTGKLVEGLITNTLANYN